MSHWDDGRLLAFADDELMPAAASEAREHLEACVACASALALLRAQRDALRGALVAADVTAPAGRVLAAVLARTEGLAATQPEGPAAASHERPAAPAGRRAGWWARKGRLAQAALLVLLLAGGASALVLTSPLRSRLERPSGVEEAPLPAPLATESSAPPAEVGAQVGPEAGRIRVALGGLPSGAEIQVTLVEGQNALVAAPEGTRFRTGNGQIEALAPAGPVRVSLPRGVGRVSLEVEGRLYLSVTAGRPLVVVPAFQQSETELSFRIP